MKRFVLLMTSLAALSLAPHAAAAPTQLAATTSWIGNTFGFGDGKWMQQDIQALDVAADGTVYTNSPWDESGAEIAAYRNGDRIAVAGATHGWGAAGGDAVTSNSSYLYAAMSIGNQNGGLVGADYPPNGYTWFGITRRAIGNIAQGAPFAGGVGNSANASKNSFLIVDTVPTGTDAGIRGLAANESELFVADQYSNRIIVFDAGTMRRKRAFDVASSGRIGRIALDTDGSLWVIAGASIAHYSAAGAMLGGAPVLPPGTVPADLTIAPSGDLYIADIGPAQQILPYRKTAGGMLQAAAPVGTLNGVNHAPAGKIEAGRFNFVTGIGFDAAGNLYVGQNGEGPRALNSASVGSGAVLQAFKGTSRSLSWELDGLVFVDGAAFDPGAPNTIYTGSKIFTMDWTKPPGKQWTYAAYTVDRIGYPDDPELHIGRDVRGEPMVRRLNGNRPYLYTLDPYSHELYVHRFDTAHGSIAIPSVMFAESFISGGFPAYQPAWGEWMWRDIDGDGRLDDREFTGNPATGSAVGNSFIWVDSAGGVWFGTPTSGIRQMSVQSFDAPGNPVYSYGAAKTYAMPAPFTRIGRVLYVAETDTMYVSGFTQAVPYDATRWKEAGPYLARYDNWSTGAPSMTYGIALPWNTASSPPVTTVGIATAGDYLFVAELYTQKIDVYDARTGTPVGYMTPGANVGGTSGYVDVELGISATRRANGEYVVLVEDDARAKILMYQWTP
ncbi:BceP [Caballeronia peredens]|nr:BceP [Caballeronia peredens]